MRKTDDSIETYLESDYNTICFSHPDKILISTWKFQPSITQYRECMEAVVSAIQHFNTGKVIFDLTKVESGDAFSDTDKEWMASQWYERALEAGYSCVAVVMPTNFFSQKTVVDLTSQIKVRIPTIYLDNMKEAVEWIRQFKYEKEKPPIFWINTKLEKASKYVAAYNRQLEEMIAERNMDIERLNEKLVEYSFFNSHRIRGPLARILGIINVMKSTSLCKNTGNDCLFDKFLDSLQESSEELDNVVKEITDLLHKENRHWEEKYGKVPYAVKRRDQKV